MIALAYFLLSTGPSTIFKVLPWWILLQLGLDALMFVFWLSAAATSRYNCDDLCNACSGWDSVSFDDLSCSCLGSYYYWYKKRSMSPNKTGLLQARRTGHSNPTGTYGAKRGLDSVMVYVSLPGPLLRPLSSAYIVAPNWLTQNHSVLFFATLVSTILWIFQNRRASRTSNTTALTGGPAPHPEAGVQNVQTEPKQDISAYPPNPQMQQQGGYPQASPQEQYPPQGQYPPQAQYPPQQYPPQQQYPTQQQQYPQQGYPPQNQQPQPMGYYGGPNEGQQREVQSQQMQQPQGPMAHQQQGEQVPNYPTPTPEMQSERRET